VPAVEGLKFACPRFQYVVPITLVVLFVICLRCRSAAPVAWEVLSSDHRGVYLTIAGLGVNQIVDSPKSWLRSARTTHCVGGSWHHLIIPGAGVPVTGAGSTTPISATSARSRSAWPGFWWSPRLTLN
jgi:hypothetical protein